ncbi:DUF3383 family protein [Sporanaerobacter acetigenes]|uniref:DUF3383 family protein n=1 Tax=Sporanaerobacter acetigenes TaxID=165813 RepID=UPI001052B8A5|nr:DUF3383 family protein [Sporanaerobacter acetigenes]
MIKNFVVNVNNLTKGVTEQGFGLILIFDNEHDLPYTLISNPAELLPTEGAEPGIKDITVDDKVYKIAQKIFMHTPRAQEVVVFGKVIEDASGIETALNELINQQKNDWFTLVTTTNTTEVIEKLSKWVMANEKLYFVTTQDLSIVGNIESTNTAIGYHNDKEDFLAEGLASNMAMALPGSITAMYEEVAGSKPSNITLTELKELHKNNGFSYIRSKGRNFVSEGKMTDGSYIDVVLGSYFIKFRLEEALFLLALNNGKIPYSDQGIAMLVAEVENVMRIATRQGIILEKDGRGLYEIIALSRSEVPKNDVANRKYNGISVKATVAGAIHSSEVTIDLVLEEVA